jgi:hypothetical protein
VAGAGQLSEAPLEPVDERALDDPPGLERELHRAQLLLAEDRLRNGDRHLGDATADPSLASSA